MSSTNKAKLREDVLGRLRALREKTEDRAKRTDSLNRHITQFLRSQQGRWAGFVALPSEPDILQAIDSSAHIEWVFPRVVDNDLQFHACADRATLKKSGFGVLEPCETDPVVDTTSIDGFLVPGIAFGRDGARLGRGKGFYDRTLQQTRAKKVGVCYSLQLFNKGFVPTETQDEFLDLIISDEGIKTAQRLSEEK